MKKKLIIFAALLVLMVACAGVALAVNVTNGSVVGWGELSSVTSIDGHAIDQINTKDPTTYLKLTKPTCTEMGMVMVKCKEDQTHDHWLYIKEFGHAWASEYDATAYAYTDLDEVVDPVVVGKNSWGVVDKVPTCTAKGHAHDICLRCKLEDNNVGRDIEMVPHVYAWDLPYTLTVKERDAKKYYNVVEAATCTADGTARRLCTVCGFEDMDLDAEGKPQARITIPMYEHNYTDWAITKKPTCAETGEAERYCIWCSAHQMLNKDLKARDEKFYNENLELLNKDWTLANIKAKKVKAEIRVDWQHDCYTHKVTYYCPYCNGELKDAGGNVIHPDIQDNDSQIVSHIWNEEPEDFDTTYTWKWESDLTEAQLKDVEKTIKEKAKANYKSIPATCELPGCDVYLCKFDEAYYTGATKHGHTKEDAVKYVIVPKTDHDWTAWEVKGTSKKNGKEYNLETRVCRKCFRTEEQVVEAGVKDGLVPEDGKLRLYVKGVPSTASGLTLVEKENAWYYLDNGYVKSEYTGFVPAFSRQWMVKNGKLDTNNDGLVEFNGSFYAISQGMLWDDWTGIWWKDGKNYLLSVGQWKKDYSGVIIDDENNNILIKNGSVDFETTEYNGHKVINGIIQM